jgi:hypothetical protein
MMLSKAAVAQSVQSGLMRACDKLLMVFVYRVKDNFWLFNNHLPLHLAQSLLQLTTDQGVYEPFKAMLTGQKQLFNSHRFWSESEIQLCLANVLKHNLQKQLRLLQVSYSNFMEFDNKIYFQEFSIGFDEMTSLQKKTHLIVYIHYVGSDTEQESCQLFGCVNMKQTTGLRWCRYLPHIGFSCLEKTAGDYDYRWS